MAEKKKRAEKKAPAAKKAASGKRVRRKKAEPSPEVQKEKAALPAFGLAEEILHGGSAEHGVRSAESETGSESSEIRTPMHEAQNSGSDRPAEAMSGGHEAVVDSGPQLQLVTFKVDSEEYGVDIGRVREIIRVGQITSVPNAPTFVKGVINIRGKVVPVLNLSKRLDVKEAPVTKHSRIVVVDSNTKPLGLLVDSVSHVLRIPESAVEPPPGEAEQARAYVKGIGKVSSRLVMIMDLERVLAREAR